MNRIVERFRELGGRGEVGLVVYLTCGDPTLEESTQLVLEAARGGADVIELGVPFSDPSADGPVIQAAMERALSTGGAAKETIARTLAVVRAVRAETQVPIVLFGYFNPMLQFGVERLAAEAQAAGVDGLLVVDLPPEESAELDAALSAHALVRIPLLAPTTSPERARAIVGRAGGFAYYVALTGVTGAGHLDPREVEGRARELRPALAGLPLAVGFGIRDGAGARAVAEAADAVVVGSALVQAVAQASDAAQRRKVAGEMVRTLKQAIRDRPARAGG